MVAIWFVAGLALLAVELHTVAFYSVFLAVGSFVAGLLALFVPDSPIWVQAAVAAVVSVVGLFALRPYASRTFLHGSGGVVSRGVHGGLVGQEALTLDTVGDEHHPGHVQLASERWLAVTDQRSAPRRRHGGDGDGGARDDVARAPDRAHRRVRTRRGRFMTLDSGVIAGIVIAVVIFVVVVAFLSSAANIVQQGYVGVVKTLGEFKSIRNPGLAIIIPFYQTLVRVDMREIPRPGDRQEVITKDNVVVAVNATIFTQVVDAKQALFSVSNFDVAIDALARTALRSVIGTLSLDEALSERERINTDVQQQMEVVTDKWGIRINRIEIVEITPPAQILQALALQKQADQEKRARILQSEGQQLSAVNIADGNRQAAIKNAEGERQAAILRAEGNRQAAILEAEGRAQAIQTVYDAIKAADPNPTLVAILQLDTLVQVRHQREHQDRHPGRELGAARRGAGAAVRAGRRPDARHRHRELSRRRLAAATATRQTAARAGPWIRRARPPARPGSPR